MAFDKRCSNTEEHEFHSWFAVEETECSGQAECKEMSHPPHTFMKNTEHWCFGICKCDLIPYLHGKAMHT